jgi:hypothetical protein
MTTGEIRNLLNANLDRRVQVIWDDGEREDVIVISVDDEGFVYDLTPPDPKTPYWNRFEEVMEIIPIPQIRIGTDRAYHAPDASECFLESAGQKRMR